MSTPVEPNPAPTPPAPPTPTPPAPPTPPTPQPPTTPPPGQAPAAEDVSSLPPWAQKKLADANAEAAKARVTAKENAAREERERLLKLLSGDSPEPLTPEQLAQQLTEARTQGTAAQQQAADTARELAVLKAAQKLGANSEALLDSRSFMATVSGLDTADPAALATAVEQQLTAALTTNPALRAGPGVPRSGADLGGGTGSGDGALTIDAQIDEATKARRWSEVIALKRQRAAQQTT
jgi:hypothetical protein